ncbi:hypothetical protein RRG08_018618 [Elysia crispata]|uniref:Uncharacterized protein n=1 Tax=Elysia crispata TaxID=231223 RepID=A0AAE1ATF2_9GAST|nr:hypothetical protein RRG08_018618 [Elysia crispata]
MNTGNQAITAVSRSQVSRCDFKCPNGRCVDSSNVCDASWTYACSAAGRNLCRKSEEHDPRCIRSDQFCNEQNDCKVATNYDESSCGGNNLLFL